jgi:hypothetical protein
MQPVGALYDVRLLQLPVAVHARAQERRAEIAREMYLIAHQTAGEIHLAASSGDGVATHAPVVPQRLAASIDALTHELSALTAEQDLQLAHAFEDGRDAIDLSYRFPGSAADASVAMIKALDEADDFCRRGDQLLALATPPDLVRYRHWYFGEFARQIAGELPTPWSSVD